MQTTDLDDIEICRSGACKPEIEMDFNINYALLNSIYRLLFETKMSFPFTFLADATKYFKQFRALERLRGREANQGVDQMSCSFLSG